jgi:hypothetical protein
MAQQPVTREIAFLMQLDAELRQQSPLFERLERYAEGIHRLQFATSRFRQTFGNLFHEFADNWMQLIIDASVERLCIQGFRFDTENEGQYAFEGDRDAWSMFRDNQLDAQSDVAHTEAVKLGKAYLLVDPHDITPNGNPTISVEHPANSVVACQAGNRLRRNAGLKEWTDHSGYVFANVFMPEGTYFFQTNKAVNDASPQLDAYGRYYAMYGNLFPLDYVGPPAAFLGERASWIPRAAQDANGNDIGHFLPHDLGVVPLIPMENNPTLKNGGRSDIASIIPIQDAINKLVLDMIIASEYASFPQRWATGIQVPIDEETGQPVADQKFLAAVSRLWTSEDPETKFGQFNAADLGNYVKAIEMLIQHVAALTRTPPHYLLGQAGSFPSGDSLAATETGLVAKCKRKMTNFSPAWEEAIRLGFKAKGDKRASMACETVWADPEQRIRAARIDGAVKMTTIGVPQPAIWEETGASPATIRRWTAMRKDMGLEEWGTDFAPFPKPQAIMGPDGQPTGQLLGPDGKPLNLGLDGNLPEEQAASQATRVTRIHD